MKQPAVLLTQLILPPYRLPLFQRLSVSGAFTITFAYGHALKGRALDSIIDPPGLSVVPVRNLYGGREGQVIYQHGMLALLRSGKYDVVIAEFNPRIVSNVLACIYARYLQVRFIWWGQGLSPRSTVTRTRLRRWLAQLADANIFYTSDQADRFVSMGVPRQKVFVALNSIDTEEIDRLAQLWPQGERNRIMYIGRLIPEKKVDLLIHGFARAHPHLKPETKLTIIGDGPERAKLEHLSTQFGLTDRVEFVGAIYQQERLAPWFNDAWVSVSPGYIGLSAIHSLAYGVPMIVAQGEPHSPEVTALEDGVNAVFFPSDDVEELAQRLILLAKDQEQWQHMCQAAQRTVKQRFSLLAMVQAFEEAVQYVQRS
jgi:glycosyltransferase involved in cell wall biosynthesis